MIVRYLLFVCLLFFASIVHAQTLAITPVFPQRPITAVVQFLPADSAGVYKTLYTPTSTFGAKCYALSVTNTDTTAQHIVTIEFQRASVKYGGVSLETELNAAYDPTVPPQTVLTLAIWPSLVNDSDGNRWFFIANGDSLVVTFATAITTGKALSLRLSCIEF